MATPKFEYYYIVKSKDIDILNHVNNVVYLQWVQDAAMKHWAQLTKNQRFDNFVWVVIRHEIDYIRQAFLGDKLLIKTWVGKSEGATSIRHVEVFRDKKIITRTLTTWKLLDAATFRSLNIPNEMLEILKG